MINLWCTIEGEPIPFLVSIHPNQRVSPKGANFWQGVHTRHSPRAAIKGPYSQEGALYDFYVTYGPCWLTEVKTTI